VGLIPGGDGAGIIDPLNQEVGGNCVLVWAPVEHGDVRRTFDVVMVVQYLGKVGGGVDGRIGHDQEVGSSGEGLGILFGECRLQRLIQGDALLFN